MKVIKKILAFPTTYFLYFLGDMVIKAIYVKYKNEFIFDRTDFLQRVGGHVYETYSVLMTSSSKVQHWGGLEKPWISVYKANKVKYK